MIIKTKWNTMCSKLSWSHYREVLSINDVNEIVFYLSECDTKNLSQRQLHEIIKNNSYNRLSSKTKNRLINQERLKINDLVPNPIIIQSKLLNEALSEYALTTTW